MISVEGISVQFSGEYLFHSVSFKINRGDKIGVIGPNGCGKTTLLRILSGEIHPEDGSINFQKGIKIGYLPQDYVSQNSDEFIFDEVYKANKEIYQLQKEEEDILIEIKLRNDKKLLDRLSFIQSRLNLLNPENYKKEVAKVLLGLGFKEEDFYKKFSELSGGWRVRIAIAKLLLSNADILLLDEPTNHLDYDSLEFLISYLKKYRGAILAISHDTHFLNQITTKTLGFAFGKVIFYNGNTQQFHKYLEEQKNQLLLEYKNQQKKIRNIERFIERFRYKATKARQVQSRIKMLEKIETIEIPEEEEIISFNFDQIPQSGKIVAQLENITKNYGEKLIFENLSLQIDRGDKIAVIGINGVGKSTLAKILANREKIDKGHINFGYNVKTSYYSQNLIDELDLDRTVLETVEFIDPDKTQSQIRTLLGCFLFHGDDVFKKVKFLSGGEKSRLLLLKILLQKSNFLILDEPTNHLDMQSKKVLQDALIDYEGTLFIVSHDVDFLNPIVNKVFEIKDGMLRIFLGNLDDFAREKTEEQKLFETETSKNSTQSKENISNQRKLQRRIEAEKRQKFYSETKELKEKINHLESDISNLETRKLELEKLFSSINQADIDRNLFEEYKLITEKIDSLLEEWSILSEKYQEIEKKYFN